MHWKTPAGMIVIAMSMYGCMAEKNSTEFSQFAISAGDPASFSAQWINRSGVNGVQLQFPVSHDALGVALSEYAVYRLSSAASCPSSGPSGANTIVSSGARIKASFTTAVSASTALLTFEDLPANDDPTAPLINPALNQCYLVRAVGPTGEDPNATSIASVGQLATISLSSISGPFAGGAATTISWTFTAASVANTDQFNVQYSTDGSTWNTIGTVAAMNGPLTAQAFSKAWTIPVLSSANVTARVTFVNNTSGASLSAQSAAFVVESVGPTVTATTVNGGATTTSNSSIPINISVSDSLTNVNRICVKSSNATPLATDSCWSNVTAYGFTPAKSLTMNPIYYNLGLAGGGFTLYVFAMNQVGEISALSNGGAGTSGLDSGSVTFTPPLPPAISNIQLVSTNTPANPPAGADLVAGIGSSMYLKWNVSSSTGLGASPISVTYSTDDVNYSALAGGAALNNAANGACTVTAGYTGCALLTSPSSAFFRLKIKATDNLGYVSYGTSNPLNTLPVNFLAGNTDLGLGGSSSSAILSPNNGLAVLSNGRIFVGDTRGLGWVNPVNGAYEILIPATGTSSGDGGNISTATLQGINNLYADFQDNLLIVDGNVVRKVMTGTSPMTISRFMGGGASAVDTVSPLNLSASSFSQLFLIPNGDIWFTIGNDPGFKVRTYHASSGQITSLYVSGTGNSFSSSQNNASCPSESFFVTFDASSNIDHLIWRVQSTSWTYTGNPPGPCGYGTTPEWRALASIDPSTGLAFLPAPSVIQTAALSGQGPDGYREAFTYYLNKGGDLFAAVNSTGNNITTQVFKFNKASMSWSTFAGVNTYSGTCADGTSSANCAMVAKSIAFSPQGKFYYVDAISKVVRTVDANGKVQTIVGDKLGSADGKQALSARFVNLSDVKIWSNAGVDHIVALDFDDARIREFTPGGSLTTVAGNEVCGTPSTTTAASSQSIVNCDDGNPRRLSVDSTTGNIFFVRAPYLLGQLTRASGLWSDIVGGWTYGPGPLALSPNYILAADLSGGGSAQGFVKIVDRGTGAMTKIVTSLVGGTSGTTFCADGTALSSCNQPYMISNNRASGAFDLVTNQWILPEPSASGRLVAIAQGGGGNMATFATLPRAISGFDLNRNVGLTTNYAYYCGSSGLLYKYNLNTGIETNLALPSGSMSCSGPVQYSASRNALIFQFVQNGLSGIAEYLNP